MFQIILGNIMAVIGIIGIPLATLMAIASYHGPGPVNEYKIYAKFLSIPIAVAELGMYMIYCKTNLIIAICMPVLSLCSLFTIALIYNFIIKRRS